MCMHVCACLCLCICVVFVFAALYFGIDGKSISSLGDVSVERAKNFSMNDRSVVRLRICAIFKLQTLYLYCRYSWEVLNGNTRV